MVNTMRATAMAVFLFGSFAIQSRAQGTGEQPLHADGSALYSTYCTTCHGAQGKGDGMFAKSLRKAPADLTGIAKRNGGVFSRTDVARIIDGRKPVGGHGG